MKKCPACEKTYEDSMKFCQVDGTPLVEDKPFDPFATIVGAPPPKLEPPAEQPDAFTQQPEETPVPEEAPAISEPDDILDMPEADPLRTMYVSEDEMKAAMGQDAPTPTERPGAADLAPPEDISSEQTLVDDDDKAPTAVDTPGSVPEPEPPSFKEPDVPAPSFGDISPPPSPFSAGSAEERPMSAPSFDEPESPRSTFNEAETMIQGGYPNPFETPPKSEVEEWTPPPAPEPSWENQQVGSNTPFQPPAVGSASQNKTLAIISLVLGIVSILCCSSFFVVGAAAIVTGFMARGKATSSPAEFGGSGLAMAGIITGAISILFGILYWILVLSGFVRLPF